ncbi:hypothetical protein ACHQM5_011358 [Ranunculus cassubicifolius]
MAPDGKRGRVCVDTASEPVNNNKQGESTSSEDSYFSEDDMDENKEKIDRISTLPDLVILVILSFLKIGDVVATSILSTRWRYLWKYVPGLDFSYCRKGMDVVDKVLFSRDANSNITKFRLYCDSKWDGSRVNAWISAVVMHKLEELTLTIHIKEPSILPPPIFLCKSLTVLKLLYDGVIRLPSSISFPSLKILELESLHFTDGYLTENFSSCPLLEELTISNCRWANILSKILISNPALKRLEIYGFTHRAGNIDYLEINAPKLVHLSLMGTFIPKVCSLFEMTSLDFAEVFFSQHYQDKPKEEIGLIAGNLLGALCHVKSLRISAQILSHAKDLSTHLPEFGKLRRLEVDKYSSYIFTGSLLLLLRISPRLLYVSFKGNRPHYGKVPDKDWESDTVAKTSLLHLKKVEYWEFVGHPVELELVQFLLENSTVLEEITLRVVWDLECRQEKKCRVLEQLLRMPRGPNRCIINMK